VELENGTVIEALMANSDPGRAMFFEVDDEVTVAWRHDAGHFLDE
jgi:spermidine/putrescine transport system ATP-binding protein